MREIKFSYIFQHNETGRFAEQIFTMEEIENTVGGFVKQCEKKFRRWSFVARRQSTGLLDKDGKEIYEGDIVEVRIDGMGTGHERPVVWDNNDATYKFGHAMLGGSDVEIIGNIYENPELLGGK